MTSKAPSDRPRQPVSVFVLDDQEIVRIGMRGLLEAEPDLRVVGEAGTASAALAQIPVLHPDVAMLDVRLGLEQRTAAAAYAAPTFDR